jgi:hypothetical protein
MISFTVSPAGKPDLLTHMFGSQIVASVGPVRMHASVLFGNRRWSRQSAPLVDAEKRMERCPLSRTAAKIWH